jgi:hypothetical protein
LRTELIATSDNGCKHEPAASKRSFREELEPRQKPTASLEAGPPDQKATKSAKGRRPKSSKKARQDAERMRGFVSRWVPSDDAVSMNLVNLTTMGILFSALRGFTRSIRALARGTARGGRKKVEEYGSQPWGAISTDSTPAPSEDEEHRQRGDDRPSDGDSQGPELRAHTEVLARKDGHQADEAEPVLHSATENEELRREIGQLCGQIATLKASRDDLRGLEAVDDEEVWIQCGPKRVIVPDRKSQGWPGLRKRIIRIFNLKDKVWELQRERLTRTGERGWTRVEQPLRNAEEGIQYRVWIKKKKRKTRAPGIRGGTTHGKPRWSWSQYDQRHGGGLAITDSSPRPG